MPLTSLAEFLGMIKKNTKPTYHIVTPVFCYLLNTIWFEIFVETVSVVRLGRQLFYCYLFRS